MAGANTTSSYKTNATILNFTLEQSPGVQFSSNADRIWKNQPFSGIQTLGDTVNTTDSTNITPDIQKHRPNVTGKDSEFGFSVNTSLDAIKDHVPQFVKSKWNRRDATDIPASGVSAAADTVILPVISAAAAPMLVENTIVKVSGSSNPNNNGYKVVSANATAGNTRPLAVAGNVGDAGTTGIIENELSSDISVTACGLAIPAADGATWAYSSSSKIGTLTLPGSTGLNFATLGLKEGQMCFIGATDVTATTCLGSAPPVTNALNDGTTAQAGYGYVRVKTLGTGSITFDLIPERLQFPSHTTNTLVFLRFGQFIQNDGLEDADFNWCSYMFEVGFNKGDVRPTVGYSTNDVFNYPKGMYASEFTMSGPLSDNSESTFSFMGIDTEVDVAPADHKVRDTSNNSIRDQIRKGKFSDVISTSIGHQRAVFQDEGGNAITTAFKSIDLTINNGVTAEEVLFKLEKEDINFGMFAVTLSVSTLFTNDKAAAAIRCGKSVNLNYAIDSNDGSVVVDIYSALLSGGSKELTDAQSITQSMELMAHKDNPFEKMIGISTIV